MDIDNDTELLAYCEKGLIECKSKFGDANLQMLYMIRVASQTLEGNQMDKAKETIFQTTNNVKNVIANIDVNILYIHNLQKILGEYLKIKFREV